MGSNFEIRVAFDPPHEIDSTADVSPLIASSNLKLTPIVLVQSQEVIPLEYLITKLSEAHALASLIFIDHPGLDAVFR